MIDAVLARELKVTMLEGPKMGEQSKFSPKSCTLVAEAEAPQADPADASSAPPQKKQKTTAEEWADAAELLGLDF